FRVSGSDHAITRIWRIASLVPRFAEISQFDNSGLMGRQLGELFQRQIQATPVPEQDPTARELSFLERLGLLVDQQWTWRENQALARRLHAAKLKGACVEEIDYRASRGLDKSMIRALAQKSAWAAQHENVFVLGPTGVGKSFVACALAQKACRDGYSA